ncbi:hypothetical protein PR048_032199 [Dryococelus australis]|uniref:Uncharacterized protein n=1 Tax=Dryococelus australis TaxID=614101 RepID=A0ABQ9G5P0_9NEOP|nr:hypothetical protein PR048_032199 [Dryococelus australis]
MQPAEDPRPAVGVRRDPLKRLAAKINEAILVYAVHGKFLPISPPFVYNERDMAQRRITWAVETGGPRVNPSNSIIVRHDLHVRKSGSRRAEPGIDKVLAFVEGEHFIRCTTRDPSVFKMLTSLRLRVSHNCSDEAKTTADAVRLAAQKSCHICKETLSTNDIGVNHDHLMDEICGHAHNKCNLNFRLPKRQLVTVFHNLQNYDAHFLIKPLDERLLPQLDGTMVIENPVKSSTVRGRRKLSVRIHGDNAETSAAKSLSYGQTRIFVYGNHAERCRWSAGFLGDLPFPPPSNLGAATTSSHSTPVVSQDLDFKCRPNLFTHPAALPSTRRLYPPRSRYLTHQAVRARLWGKRLRSCRRAPFAPPTPSQPRTPPPGGDKSAMPPTTPQPPSTSPLLKHRLLIATLERVHCSPSDPCGLRSFSLPCVGGRGEFFRTPRPEGHPPQAGSHTAIKKGLGGFSAVSKLRFPGNHHSACRGGQLHKQESPCCSTLLPRQLLPRRVDEAAFDGVLCLSPVSSSPPTPRPPTPGNPEER